MTTTEFIIDAITVLGTAVFALASVLAVLEKRVDILSVAVLGVITDVGGGVVRDTLLQRASLLLTEELYSIPVALGCLLYTGFLMFFRNTLNSAR